MALQEIREEEHETEGGKAAGEMVILRETGVAQHPVTQEPDLLGPGDPDGAPPASIGLGVMMHKAVVHEASDGVLLPPLPDASHLGMTRLGSVVGAEIALENDVQGARDVRDIGNGEISGVASGLTEVSATPGASGAHGANSPLDSATTSESGLSSAIELDPGPDGDGFDLSKALEMGRTSTATPLPSMPSGQTSLKPAKTAAASPKLSLKKKFSTSIIASTGNSTTQPSGGSDQNSFQCLSPSSTGMHSHHHHHHPLQHPNPILSVRSFESSPKSSILPRLSTSMDAAHDQISHSSSAVRRGQGSRKFSIGSSGSSSHSFYDGGEFAYRPPPTLVEHNGGSQVSLSALTSPGTIAFPASGDKMAGHPSPKGSPLLRRASSAILRKSSLTRKDSGRDSQHELRSVSSFSALPYDTQPLAKQRSKPRKILSLRSNCGSPARSRAASAAASLAAADAVDSGAPELPRNGESRSISNKLGSKFRRGLTRMISGSSLQLANATEREHDLHRGDTGSVSLTPRSFEDGSPLFETFEDVLGASQSQMTSFADNTSVHKGVLDRSVSSNVGSLPKRMPPVKRAGSDGKDGTNVSVCTARNNSVFSGTNTSGSSSNESEQEDITVDIDDLTKSLPVITVTEQLGAMNATPIQEQSNLAYDIFYKHHHHTASDPRRRKPVTDVLTPHKISLREYIGVLMKQQQVEDERFELLERNFSASGWCSEQDLTNLRQKRIVINKKWAERISFYQNKLEA
ncbi:LAMI_0A06678g1_1 [Lachancea mirantina]|uniref:LAMI_0A06678g1_1 n=1 Tax=Lachancea mirantina TaxID=1230905 RepID=A0A1G4IQS2_9SACH|nr:LAMI_0A06678g1_1 [Lachancea mirantina]